MLREPSRGLRDLLPLGPSLAALVNEESGYIRVPGIPRPRVLQGIGYTRVLGTTCPNFVQLRSGFYDLDRQAYWAAEAPL